MTEDLARHVDAAQSILHSPLAVQAQKLERAFADSSAETARAMARLSPDSGAEVREIAGGLSILAGTGSPFTQGLAMGHSCAVAAADLDAMEAHLLSGGGTSCQLELSPFAHPTLPSLLATRGYRVHEWQLVWTCDLEVPTASPARAPAPSLRIRPMERGEEELFLRTVLAGFLESEDVPEDFIAMMRPSAYADASERYLAFLDDDVIGAGSLGWKDGVAIIGGSSVRASWRRRGAQGALLRARLARARELGCTVAYSSTLPGTSSRRNMERHGFAVAYPKLVMLRVFGDATESL